MPQSGTNAEAIRANLKRVKLPPGFRVDLYAIVPDARHMAVAPSTNMLFVGTRKTTVWAVTDRNSDGVADEVKAFAPSLKFQVPNGVCWTKDGFLIVAESAAGVLPIVNPCAVAPRLSICAEKQAQSL